MRKAAPSGRGVSAGDWRRKRLLSLSPAALACILSLLAGSAGAQAERPTQSADPARPARAAAKRAPAAKPQETPPPAQEKKSAGPQLDKAGEKKDAPPPVPQSGEAAQAPNFQTLAHARQAGVAICTDTLARLLPQVVDAPHDAFSFWSRQNPDDHLFGSIAALAYQKPSAPRGAAIVLATPSKSGKCEGAGVQVIPSARACGAIQAALMNAGRAVANLQGLPLIESPAGQRYLLAPSAGNGCILIAVTILVPK